MIKHVSVSLIPRRHVANLVSVTADKCDSDCAGTGTADGCGGPRGFYTVYDAVVAKPQKLDFTVDIDDSDQADVNTFTL